MNSLLKKNMIIMLAGSALTIGGFSLSFYSDHKKSQIIEEFSQTKEFENLVNNEKEQIEKDYFLNKINEKEYKKRINFLKTSRFIENKISKSNSQYNVELKNSKVCYSLGTAMAISGVYSVVVSGLFFAENRKQNKREQKTRNISNIIDEINQKEEKDEHVL